MLADARPSALAQFQQRATSRTGSESSARDGGNQGPISGRSAPPVRHAFPASGWVDEQGVVGDAAFEYAPALVRSCSFQARKYDAWVTRQDRNLSFTGLFAQMRFLIHDRRHKFSADFDEVERERARKRALSSCLER
jgi:hypothetical protein